MSLNVHNAYRFSLARQSEVHATLMSNCEKLTTSLAKEMIRSLTAHLDGLPREEWTGELLSRMSPSIPKELVERRAQYAVMEGNKDELVRGFLHDYHKYVNSYPSTWPYYDTVTTWTYVWDRNYGYVVLFLPVGVEPDAMVDGISELEPYSYFGGTGETNSTKDSADTVRSVWESIIGNDSVGHAGATASLSGFELQRAFGMV